ncbi:hypothetical protein WL797_07930 [Leuconostoc mesenteroides]
MQPNKDDVINDLLQQVANLTFVNAQLKSVVKQYEVKEQENTKEEEDK